jgi:hypothetical protein
MGEGNARRGRDGGRDRAVARDARGRQRGAGGTATRLDRGAPPAGSAPRTRMGDACPLVQLHLGGRLRAGRRRATRGASSPLVHPARVGLRGRRARAPTVRSPAALARRALAAPHAALGRPRCRPLRPPAAPARPHAPPARPRARARTHAAHAGRARTPRPTRRSRARRGPATLLKSTLRTFGFVYDPNVRSVKSGVPRRRLVRRLDRPFSPMSFAAGRGASARAPLRRRRRLALSASAATARHSPPTSPPWGYPGTSGAHAELPFRQPGNPQPRVEKSSRGCAWRPSAIPPLCKKVRKLRENRRSTRLHFSSAGYALCTGFGRTWGMEHVQTGALGAVGGN